MLNDAKNTSLQNKKREVGRGEEIHKDRDIGYKDDVNRSLELTSSMPYGK